MSSLRSVQSVLHNFLYVFTIYMFATITGASPGYAQSPAFIVGHDRGGIIGVRANEVRRLNNSGRRVEIRGTICLSSCTMYLGAENVCVNPEASFGFHGSSYYGQPLAPEDFEYWSKILASHYPPAIRKWFMTTARHKRTSYYTIRGNELIQQGVRPCS